MPFHSLSLENLRITIDCTSKGLCRPILPRRSSSCHCLTKDKNIGSVDLTQPYGSVFPSPSPSESSTPHVQASPARDAFPFPLKPAELSPKAKGDHLPDQSPRGRPRYRSFGNPYLTPSPSPDRYIPSRNTRDEHVNSYKVGKSPERLSSAEKLLRHKSATPDPFHARSPSQVPDPARPSRGDHFGNNTPSRQRTVSGLVGHPSGVIGSTARRPSAGAVWNVGGTMFISGPGPITGVSDGRGGVLGSGTNAPMFSSRFFEQETSDQILERFEGRIAAALELDQTSRTLSISRSPERDRIGRSLNAGNKRKQPAQTAWKDGQWLSDGDFPARKVQKTERRAVPSTPFRYVQPYRYHLLDAPQLRDDFYCSVLAYCHTCKTLAVGLNNRVYLWSEESGVEYPRVEENRRNTYVTSLSFSSTQGGNSILAIGRNNGQISLWSLDDENDRFQSQQPDAVACLSFKPVVTRRESEGLGVMVDTEELLVGDERGVVRYYSIEWAHAPGNTQWYGAMNLMAKIEIHTQQICGLAWSPDGEYFATGGNDNICCLFGTRDVLTPQPSPFVQGPLQMLITGLIPSFVPNAPAHHTLGSTLGYNPLQPPDVIQRDIVRPLRPHITPGLGGIPLQVTEGHQRHKWIHSAAVKAIAFCPWQRGLIATGGGSNDRAIHFYHAYSGACLATISVQAQVTSLIWSTTRREIAATFGYAQPEHPYRIAVFSWPDCRQVVAIPWAGEMRALYAIPYPGAPNEASRQQTEGGRWWSRTAEEGCIVVASSDESVKFHEVWAEARKSTGGREGLLGGSDILESLEGLDKEGGDIIR